MRDAWAGYAVRITQNIVAETTKQWTILEILRWTTDFFREKAIDNPRLTAEVLLAHTLQKDRMYLYVHFDQPLYEDERAGFRALITQRAQGMPTQYLAGMQEFWSLAFKVTPDVLIPRPETEHLVEAAMNLAKEFPTPTIVDIGTGSGIIAVSLKKELPQAAVHAVDLSERALAIAQYNAAALLDGDNSIICHHGDLFTPLYGHRFDLIVSNPPYIATADYAGLAREVKDHEPKLALHAGEKGLDVYERLIADAKSYLNPGGYVLVEIGYGQKEDVVKIFEENGYGIHEVIPDYAGIERVVTANQKIHSTTYDM